MVSAVVVLFYVVLMAQYDILLTVVGVLVAGANVAMLKFFARRRIDFHRRLSQERGQLYGVAASGIQMIETLKTGGIESDFFARWASRQAKAANTQQCFAVSERFVGAIPRLLFGANTAFVLGWGGLHVIQGHMTMGTLIAFQVLLATFLAPFNALMNVTSSLHEVQGSIPRLEGVLHHDLDPMLVDFLTPSHPGTLEVSRLSGQLEMKNVTFGYSRFEPPLLEGFNLTVRPGARIALVGPSGGGKSTVVRLVSGLCQPWSGEILYDDKPRLAWPRLALVNSIAAVDQDIFLFEGTILENLTLWESSVPESRVVAAARDACIHDDILSRPGGYRAHIAEAGGDFSGGQRQRLEIARALVGNPSLLILDEATSALDPITEKVIDDNLRRRGCSCLIVAHRLSTIRDCDEIIVLDHGKVAERGIHEALIENDGPYSRLIAEA